MRARKAPPVFLSDELLQLLFCVWVDVYWDQPFSLAGIELHAKGVRVSLYDGQSLLNGLAATSQAQVICKCSSVNCERFKSR